MMIGRKIIYLTNSEGIVLDKILHKAMMIDRPFNHFIVMNIKTNEVEVITANAIKKVIVDSPQSEEDNNLFKSNV